MERNNRPSQQHFEPEQLSPEAGQTLPNLLGQPEQQPHNGEENRFEVQQPKGILGSIDSEQDLESFVEALRQNGEQLHDLVQEFIRKPKQTLEEKRDDLALGIYLDVVLKQDVFGIDPFASNHLGDEEVQEDREAIAFMASEWVANQWFKEHPESEAAKNVVELNIYDPSGSNLALLQEMWPSIVRKITKDY